MRKRPSLLLLPALGLFLAITLMAEPAAGVDSGPTQQSGKPPAAAAPQKTLFDRLGGTYAIATVVDDFIEALLVDDILNANPAIKEARARVPKAGLKFHVTSMVCQATGGPQKYTGRTMRDAHAHLRITEKEWDEMVKVFVRVLDKYKVPKAEQGELLQIVETTKGDIVVAEATAAVK
jgi:hemoglobin